MSGGGESVIPFAVSIYSTYPNVLPLRHSLESGDGELAIPFLISILNYQISGGGELFILFHISVLNYTIIILETH